MLTGQKLLSAVFSESTHLDAFSEIFYYQFLKSRGKGHHDMVDDNDYSGYGIGLCAQKLLKRFDDMMTRVGSGTITGIPLAPNEQVLRAVCKWYGSVMFWPDLLTSELYDFLSAKLHVGFWKEKRLEQHNRLCSH
ncbi:hypothetical protein DICVIV_13748 [Dictyocaulus viviparus]|uniref:Uncharacterized protein n=1 Tax=Dictyocaulus viviparus TaxID=29172 RepID=A0A0D8XD19_DICVI|nr:hypothetical protein DICVIV_13748 [Dictyocaulus viviparus]